MTSELIATYGPLVQNILIGAVTAAVYALVFYVKKRMKQQKEKFDKMKFAATILVGAGVGVGLAATGMDITQGNVETTLTAYVGTIALVESGLKAVARFVKRKREKRARKTSLKAQKKEMEALKREVERLKNKQGSGGTQNASSEQANDGSAGQPQEQSG